MAFLMYRDNPSVGVALSEFVLCYGLSKNVVPLQRLSESARVWIDVLEALSAVGTNMVAERIWASKIFKQIMCHS